MAIGRWQVFLHSACGCRTVAAVSPVADWSDGYYAYEAALEELPVRITVLVPTGHYLQRLRKCMRCSSER